MPYKLCLLLDLPMSDGGGLNEFVENFNYIFKFNF